MQLNRVALRGSGAGRVVAMQAAWLSRSCGRVLPFVTLPDSSSRTACGLMTQSEQLVHCAVDAQRLPPASKQNKRARANG